MDSSTIDKLPENPWHQLLKQLKLKHPSNVTFGYLNICHIANKFERLINLINNNIDVLCIAETKLDSSFPINQFIIPGYSAPFRLDGPKIKEASGGLLVYINQNIPSKLLNKFKLADNFQALPIELNLMKSKWLLVPIYRPETYKKKEFIIDLLKLIDIYSDTYDNILILGDFNMEASDVEMQKLIQSYDLYSMIKKPTCFKSRYGRCIDLMLTSKKYSFMNSLVLENGESDCHAMIYSMLKSTFIKLKRLTIHVLKPLIMRSSDKIWIKTFLIQ